MKFFEDRAELVIARNKATKEIVNVAIEELNVKEGDKLVEGLKNEQKGIYY
jgi:hypothetical protein